MLLIGDEGNLKESGASKPGRGIPKKKGSGQRRGWEKKYKGQRTKRGEGKNKKKGLGARRKKGKRRERLLHCKIRPSRPILSSHYRKGEIKRN
jgi:hypothetical protein